MNIATDIGKLNSSSTANADNAGVPGESGAFASRFRTVCCCCCCACCFCISSISSGFICEGLRNFARSYTSCTPFMTSCKSRRTDLRNWIESTLHELNGSNARSENERGETKENEDEGKVKVKNWEKWRWRYRKVSPELAQCDELCGSCRCSRASLQTPTGTLYHAWIIFRSRPR